MSKEPLIRYVRDHKRNPIGVIVAISAKRIGWAIVRENEKWDRREGLAHAASHAVFGWTKKIPNRQISVYEGDNDGEVVTAGNVATVPAAVLFSSHIEKIKERAKIYFADKKKGKEKTKKKIENALNNVFGQNEEQDIPQLFEDDAQEAPKKGKKKKKKGKK